MYMLSSSCAALWKARQAEWFRFASKVAVALSVWRACCIAMALWRGVVRGYSRVTKGELERGCDRVRWWSERGPVLGGRQLLTRCLPDVGCLGLSLPYLHVSGLWGGEAGWQPISLWDSVPSHRPWKPLAAVGSDEHLEEQRMPGVGGVCEVEYWWCNRVIVYIDICEKQVFKSSEWYKFFHQWFFLGSSRHICLFACPWDVGKFFWIGLFSFNHRLGDLGLVLWISAVQSLCRHFPCCSFWFWVHGEVVACYWSFGLICCDPCRPPITTNLVFWALPFLICVTPSPN